jgi:hypothetical protein
MRLFKIERYTYAVKKIRAFTQKPKKAPASGEGMNEDCRWTRLCAENRLDQNSSVAAGRLPNQKRDLQTRACCQCFVNLVAEFELPERKAPKVSLADVAGWMWS